MSLGYYKIGIKYLQKYKKNHEERNEIVNRLIEKCQKEITGNNVFGLKDDLFLDALEFVAHQLHTNVDDEDIIWGDIVPDIIQRLLDEIDKKETHVNSEICL